MVRFRWIGWRYCLIHWLAGKRAIALNCIIFGGVPKPLHGQEGYIANNFILFGD